FTSRARSCYFERFWDRLYIDAVVLRDRDANTAWHDEAHGTLEERVYSCQSQNWRASQDR
ncbi:MAG: hypothetical protein KJZ54_02675, partial [Phycisphaerales bacterium]|nr:hypothetical protein [Phycisphaerales bacterium]